MHTYLYLHRENSITGMNAEIDYIPSGDVTVPMAMPEVAKVVDNADPKSLGRVKVQFVWHRLEDHPNAKTSSWMRVQTPDAGSSDAVEKNRGFFFIPEIGDQVMVGYEYGDSSVSIDKNFTHNTSGDASVNTEGGMSITTTGQSCIVGHNNVQIESSGKMLIASQKKMNIQSVDIVDIAKG